jgi:hypothetical protein
LPITICLFGNFFFKFAANAVTSKSSPYPIIF